VSRATAFGLVAIESGFDSLAISSAGAVGLTQVKPSTARIYDKSVSVESLQKVDENLNIGLRYYHDLLHMFDGDVYLALAAYNMGPTAVAKRIEGGRKVSMEYSNKVLGK
jgi:soluble lytic murein transglycosylase-like protein